jgi:flagellar protein FlbD
VILVTRLNGSVFALNPDLVERADRTPDTVITLVDGTKYVITESLPEFIALVRDYRAGVIATAQWIETDPAEPDTDDHQPEATDGSANVVPLRRRER